MKKIAEITGEDNDRLRALFESNRDEFHKEARRLLGAKNPTGDPLSEELKLYQAAASFYRSAQAIKKETRLENSILFDYASARKNVSTIQPEPSCILPRERTKLNVQLIARQPREGKVIAWGAGAFSVVRLSVR